MFQNLFVWLYLWYSASGTAVMFCYCSSEVDRVTGPVYISVAAPCTNGDPTDSMTHTINTITSMASRLHLHLRCLFPLTLL